jgi:hypothetical protein
MPKFLSPEANHDPQIPVADDTPLRLSVAAALAFPDGTMTASGLRSEARRGRLVIERIANKDFTTMAEINKMRQLCRVEQKAHISGFGQNEEAKAISAPTRPLGLSSTEGSSSPRDALRLKLRQLSKSSANMSLPNTSHLESKKT